MPIFEVLDARITSALNKIIHDSQFKRTISLEEQKAQKQDRGAGLSHSMDSGIFVQNQNFTRNPEKLAKVLGAR